jgi:hypothetical protein
MATCTDRREGLAINERIYFKHNVQQSQVSQLEKF